MASTLTKKKLYDYRDIDPIELKLIRVGHHLWAQLRKSRKSYLLGECGPIEEAIETIIRLKREYRHELKERRKVEGQKIAARLRPPQ